MKKFKSIAIVGLLNITQDGKNAIRKYSQSPINFPNSQPSSSYEIIKQIGDADAILVSWENLIDKVVLQKTSNLKYIGICATNMANIDIKSAKSRGIAVTNVENYGDEATAEYIFSQLLNLVRGFGEYQWKDRPSELFGKTIGIVGMGAVGREVLRLAKGFGMKVVYYTKTRKPEIESEQVTFTQLDDLILRSDFVTLHVPKNTEIFKQNEFDLMTPGKVLINTCLGKVFDIGMFKKWMERRKNYAIFDRSTSDEYYKELKDLPNVVFPDVIGGITIESRERLTQKVIDNLEKYLKR